MWVREAFKCHGENQGKGNSFCLDHFFVFILHLVAFILFFLNTEVKEVNSSKKQCQTDPKHRCIS